MSPQGPLPNAKLDAAFKAYTAQCDSIVNDISKAQFALKLLGGLLDHSSGTPWGVVLHTPLDDYNDDVDSEVLEGLGSTLALRYDALDDILLSSLTKGGVFKTSNWPPHLRFPLALRLFSAKETAWNVALFIETVQGFVEEAEADGTDALVDELGAAMDQYPEHIEGMAEVLHSVLTGGEIDTDALDVSDFDWDLSALDDPDAA